MEKFEGRIMELPEGTHLCSREYLIDQQNKRKGLTAEVEKLKGQVEDLENEKLKWQEERAELLEEKRLVQEEKKTGTVAGREGRKAVLDDVQKEEIRTLRNAGHSLREIAEHFNVSHETIRNIDTEQQRVQKERETLTPQEAAWAVKNFKDGHSTQVIAKHIKKDDKAIRMIVADAVGYELFCFKCMDMTKQYQQGQETAFTCSVCGSKQEVEETTTTEPVERVEPAVTTGSKVVDVRAGKSDAIKEMERLRDSMTMISSDFRVADSSNPFDLTPEQEAATRKTNIFGTQD